MFAANIDINNNHDEQINIPNNDPSEAVKSALLYIYNQTSETSSKLFSGVKFSHVSL